MFPCSNYVHDSFQTLLDVNSTILSHVFVFIFTFYMCTIFIIILRFLFALNIHFRLLEECLLLLVRFLQIFGKNWIFQVFINLDFTVTAQIVSNALVIWHRSYWIYYLLLFLCIYYLIIWLQDWWDVPVKIVLN